MGAKLIKSCHVHGFERKTVRNLGHSFLILIIPLGPLTAYSETPFLRDVARGVPMLLIIYEAVLLEGVPYETIGGT